MEILCIFAAAGGVLAAAAILIFVSLLDLVYLTKTLGTFLVLTALIGAGSCCAEDRICEYAQCKKEI